MKTDKVKTKAEFLELIIKKHQVKRVICWVCGDAMATPGDSACSDCKTSLKYKEWQEGYHL